MKRLLIPSFVLAALGAGCTASPPRPATDAPPVAVATAPAAVTDLASSFEAGGIVRARSTAAIASRIMAPILAVHVRPGDRVRRGAPLVTLDAREITANRARAAAALSSAGDAARAAEAEARAAEAAVALGRATYDRIRTLHDKRSATAQELDQATAAVATADAQLAGSRARIAAATAAQEAARASTDAATVAASYAVLTAPFDGLVTERAADPGSMAIPGARLLTLEGSTGFRLEVQLDEARAAQVAVGQTADVAVGDRAESADRWAPARLVEIARIDPTAHSFLAKLDLADGPNLRSGAFGRARFAGSSRRTLTVPAAAIVRRGQMTFVFTVASDHRVRLQPVSPGAATGDRVEVQAGVHEGDLVVTHPPAALSDGARIGGERR